MNDPKPQRPSMTTDEMVILLENQGFTNCEANARVYAARMVQESYNERLATSFIGQNIRESAMRFMAELDSLKTNREVNHAINAEFTAKTEFSTEAAYSAPKSIDPTGNNPVGNNSEEVKTCSREGCCRDKENTLQD